MPIFDGGPAGMGDIFRDLIFVIIEAEFCFFAAAADAESMTFDDYVIGKRRDECRMGSHFGLTWDGDEAKLSIFTKLPLSFHSLGDVAR